MILVWLIGILLVGGLLAWIANKWSSELCRWTSLLALAVDFVLIVAQWMSYSGSVTVAKGSKWLKVLDWAWIPQFGIRFHLGMDGLSLILIVLTLFLGMLSVLVSWKEIDKRVGFFHFNLMWILAGIVGVFLALDLFLFYFFWEVMLVPMYFLIGIWGHERRIYAAFKFFIFTQASGLLMLLAILGLYFIHGQNTGEYTFDYVSLIGTTMDPKIAYSLMLGFLIAFVVKLPVVPVHNWLPDAHTQAPTAGSVILAGLLLKTGAYGIIRFVIPFFPEASQAFAPTAMLLGVISILYGAKLAFAQTDLKRLVAYTSVSHMGFVMLGAFAFNPLGYQGVVMQMITHGISTGALFILVGTLQERIHTRDINQMGGMWPQIPKMGVVGMIFAMASLGLPGLGNFIAEFLVLLGAFKVNMVLTIIASTGLIASAIYSLRIIQRVFHGEPRKKWNILDYGKREMGIMVPMIIVIIWLGVYPQPVLDTVKPALDRIENFTKDKDQMPEKEKAFYWKLPKEDYPSKLTLNNYKKD